MTRAAQLPEKKHTTPVTCFPYLSSCSTPPHAGPYSSKASAALGFTLHEIEKIAFYVEE
jgi:hypothetical protein